MASHLPNKNQSAGRVSRLRNVAASIDKQSTASRLQLFFLPSSPLLLLLLSHFPFIHSFVRSALPSFSLFCVEKF